RRRSRSNLPEIARTATATETRKERENPLPDPALVRMLRAMVKRGWRALVFRASRVLRRASRWLDQAALHRTRRVLSHMGALTRTTHWLGTKALKNPLDLWVFQEIIYETNPEVIVV